MWWTTVARLGRLEPTRSGAIWAARHWNAIRFSGRQRRPRGSTAARCTASLGDERRVAWTGCLASQFAPDPLVGDLAARRPPSRSSAPGQTFRALMASPPIRSLTRWARPARSAAGRRRQRGQREARPAAGRRTSLMRVILRTSVIDRPRRWATAFPRGSRSTLHPACGTKPFSCSARPAAAREPRARSWGRSPASTTTRPATSSARWTCRARWAGSSGSTPAAASSCPTRSRFKPLVAVHPAAWR